MARIGEGRIRQRTVDRLSVDDRDTIFWDRDLHGFGVRVYPSGTKVYVVQARGQGRSQRITLGRHGALSADEARRRAAGSSPGSRPGTSRPRWPRLAPLRWRRSRGGTSGSTWRFIASRERGCSTRRSSAGTSCPRSAIPRSRPSVASTWRPCTTVFAIRPTLRTGQSTSSPGSSTWPRSGVCGHPATGTRPGRWRSTRRASTSASSPRRSSGAWEGCWTPLRRARAVHPRRPSRPYASSYSPAAAGARSSGFAGSTSISGRGS